MATIIHFQLDFVTNDINLMPKGDTHNNPCEELVIRSLCQINYRCPLLLSRADLREPERYL